MATEYISRKAVKNAIHRDLDMQDLYLPIEFIELLDDITAADVRPARKAKWECSEQQGLWFSRCTGEDGCGGYVPGCTSYRFCPNCGADMRPERRTEE